MNPEPETLAVLERLIGFDTTSRNSNRPLIDFVAELLRAQDVELRLTPDREGHKANLFATIGPSDRPGIILSGHTDTVPVDGQVWTSDPYRLTQRGGRLHGRGVVDMKGFLAVAIAAVPRMKAANLAIPIHLALSYDEEVGCLGVPHLLADLAAQGLRPGACLVGEPSGMNVIRAHKGKVGCHVTVTGRSAHSALPHLGANAVEAVGAIAAHLHAIGRRLATNGPHDPTFDPPYTSLQVCRIAGGIAVNVVPAQGELDFDIRFLPGQDPHALINEARHFADREILPALRAVAPEAEITWELVPGSFALGTGADEEVTLLALRLSGTSETFKVGFGTEAGFFQAAGIPTIVCGPGSIDQAHTPDEFITLDQVASCEHFVGRLIESCGTGGLA